MIKIQKNLTFIELTVVILATRKFSPWNDCPPKKINKMTIYVDIYSSQFQQPFKKYRNKKFEKEQNAFSFL